MNGVVTVDVDGMLVSDKIHLKRYRNLEHGDLDAVNALVLHQTDTRSSSSVFNSYAVNAHGAHFLIDKSGKIYQTASVKKRCYHVGARIKAKCLTLYQESCSDPELIKFRTMTWRQQINNINEHERQKDYPDRYPVNSDSIGIELVGRHLDDERYESVTALQLTSVQWLIDELYRLFSLDSDDVYRHPEVSYKHPGEAASVTWK
ncbi:peptidoglycan recognition protein family protein [Thaumasiovibrio subtropicus]|uniref:peptidoglycan recognition protein family protein n=1 Tax=Thaumasiovibrio subtropicus TaxID=1891207 RepID=UPI000B35A2AF|nr:peptidoglycan recognition family protein [Thaumasiovibrio subtropicus]